MELVALFDFWPNGMFPADGTSVVVDVFGFGVLGLDCATPP